MTSAPATDSVPIQRSTDARGDGGEERAARRRYRRMMLALLAAGIATFAELYAVQGVLPELARDLKVTPADAALTVSAATTGLALGVLGWAGIADRIGRLLSMRIAVLGAVILGALACAVPDLSTLVGLRFLSGAVLGAVPVLAVSYVHENLTARRAAAAAAVYISGTTIGGAAGRLIAGPLGEPLGWRGALLVVGAVSLAAALVFILLAPTSPATPPVTRPLVAQPVAAEATEGGAASTSFAHLTQRQRIRRALRFTLLRLDVQALLLTGCFVAVYNFLAFRLEAAPFHLDPGWVSLLFLAYGAGTITSRLAGKWLPRVGAERAILVGLAALLAGLVLMAFDSVAIIVVGLVLFTGGQFLAHASAVAATGRRADHDHRSQASALYNIAFYLGSGVGGWALGLVFQQLGWTAMTLTIGGVLVALAVFTATGVRRRADAQLVRI
ncbi:MFS transporter [Schumannella soli]|uniref:MFS transporter n=1 Tax=Schumannella soli TaxID=2590779 RepID=A0A506XMR2_9MICO|nr:MFS transporter [Schumannella soli]TPW73851.1 MFS transporter [Schumannella soli]